MTVENDQELREILLSAKTIACVGVSSNEEKVSNGIFQYLRDHGYHMVPVNPTAPEILGEKSYADLSEVREKVDVVQVFRRAEGLPPVVEAAIQIGANVVWMQEGIVNEAAAATGEAAGLKVVMDHYMRKEHQRLIGH